MRELAFQQLQEVLASRDLELAKLQQKHSEIVAEVSELRKIRKREGLNIDYLKNIVIQVIATSSIVTTSSTTLLLQ